MWTALTLVALAWMSFPLGLAAGGGWALPLFHALPAYATLIRRLTRGDRMGAVRLMLVWAAALAVGGTLCFVLWPTDPGARIVHGLEYRDEMFEWIRTGRGAESDPTRFLPQHALHLVAFVALGLASGGVLAILMGAVLMDYMSYYVASLARSGVPAIDVLLLGWQPWAIARVAAFCILGVLTAEPLTRRWSTCVPRDRTRRYLITAAALLLADVVLKSLLASQWGEWLRTWLRG